MLEALATGIGYGVLILVATAIVALVVNALAHPFYGDRELRDAIEAVRRQVEADQSYPRHAHERPAFGGSAMYYDSAIAIQQARDFMKKTKRKPRRKAA